MLVQLSTATVLCTWGSVAEVLAIMLLPLITFLQPVSLHKISLFLVLNLFNWLLPIVLSLPIHQLHYVGFMSHNQLSKFFSITFAKPINFWFYCNFLSFLVYLLFLCSWSFLSIWLSCFSPFLTFLHFFLVPFGCSASSFLIYFQSYSSIKTIVTLYWKTSYLHPLVLSSAQDKKSLQVSSLSITSIVSVPVPSLSYLILIPCTQSTSAHSSS